MTDRRVLVTGAGSGIGHRVASAFALAGAAVVFHHRTPRPALSRELARLRDLGHDVHAVRADLSVAGAATDVVLAAAGLLGGLDVLVNVAGETRSVPLEDESPEAFTRLIWTNLGSVLFATQAALPHLERSANPSVINTTSAHAVAGLPDHASYAATKAGLIGLTRELAIELAPRRIRVNAIGPGLVTVPRIVASPGYSRRAIDAQIPLGRAGDPQDIANAVLFLASDLASWVTGQVLWVDGGTNARMGFWWPGENRARHSRED